MGSHQEQDRANVTGGYEERGKDGVLRIGRPSLVPACYEEAEGKGNKSERNK